MNSSGYMLTGDKIPSEGPREGGKKNVPPFVLDRLKSRNEGVVLLGIRDMVENRIYPKDEVCELLVGMLRRGIEGPVAVKAGDALIVVLGKATPSVSARTIREGLFAVNDMNGWLLSRIAVQPVLSGEIRKAAIDLLGKYREGDIGKDTLQEIERLLDAAVSNEKDDPRIQKEIQTVFGFRGWRPRISSVPPSAPWKGAGNMLREMPTLPPRAPAERKPLKS